MITELLATLALSILSDEVLQWTPTVAKYIIYRNSRKLSDDLKDRMIEEWCSHLNQVPGKVGKLFFAFSTFQASCDLFLFENQKYFRGFVFQRIFDIITSVFIICLLSPVMLCIGLVIKLSSSGPILTKKRIQCLDGEEIIIYHFRTTRVSEEGQDHCQSPFILELLRKSDL
ncbi:MAG: hypothetical protein RLZZ74_3724 [Cyanobacteriota bacterium]